MIPLEFDLLAKPRHFIEGLGIGDGDGGVVGKGSKPFELVLVDMDATEHGKDTQGLTLKDQGLAAERNDSFRLGPLGPVNRRILSELSRDEHWCPSAADSANLPDVQRDATEASSDPVPVLARVVDGPPGARQEVEAARLVRARGPHETGGGTDITGGDQPDAG